MSRAERPGPPRGMQRKAGSESWPHPSFCVAPIPVRVSISSSGKETENMSHQIILKFEGEKKACTGSGRGLAYGRCSGKVCCFQCDGGCGRPGLWGGVRASGSLWQAMDGPQLHWLWGGRSPSGFQGRASDREWCGQREPVHPSATVSKAGWWQQHLGLDCALRGPTTPLP